ncbi:hypothetical protein NV379_10470 [Paenibacillus sp. N1-5-1-14]|uniref:hypothetical protein n=1 Tax=Paenibacillus radicibacter TaxID=2972488 RepID=UPI002158E199|nr:hypothetical protein [Paenibacillus radicibacter]MCR8643082.1 hypothetical protein [Paenibacillus radicibacter]
MRKLFDIGMFLIVVAAFFLLIQLDYKPAPAYSYVNQADLDAYIEEKLNVSTFGGKPTVAAYDEVGFDRRGAQTYLYTWVLKSQYTIDKDGKKVMDGTAVSLPVAFLLHNENGRTIVRDYDSPRDGNLYANDMNLIFPKHIQAKLNLNQERTAARTNKLQVIAQDKLR